MYRLDRKSFKKHSFKEAGNDSQNYSHLDLNERLKIAFYLNSVAYHFPLQDPPKIDKTHFEKRKRIK